MNSDVRNFYVEKASAIGDYMQRNLRLRPFVDYRALNVVDGPHILTLVVAVNPKHARLLMGQAEPLSMACHLNRGVSVRIDRGPKGSLLFEIPKDGGVKDGKPYGLHYNLPVSSLLRRHQRPFLASLGLTDECRPAWIDFSSPITAHALIAGSTGSGKTNALRLIVFDLAKQNEPEELRMLLIQTIKGGAAWRPFERLPHLLRPIVIDDALAWHSLSWAVAEIDRRGREKRITPRVFIFIDEVQALLDQSHLRKAVLDIAATGREFGIHLIMATQDPTAEQLGSATIKRNLSARLVGRVDSPTAAHVAMGQNGTLAHLLTGPGDMLLGTPTDGVRRIAAAFCTDKDTESLPRVESLQAVDMPIIEDTARLPDIQNRADEFLPDQIALALTPRQGINKLQRAFNCGPAKAQRVRQFADGVQAELTRLGYCIAQLMPSGADGIEGE